MTVTTGGRGLSVAWASSGACSPSPTTYSSSRTAWKLNADAISSIMSKSSRWLIVTICPSSLNVNATISFAGTFRMLASSVTVMNSVTRTSVFSRSFSSRRFSSWMSRKLGPSSRRCTPLRATGPLIEASVREMFCATASWSTSDFLPFLRFFPLSRRRSSSGPTPGAAEATGRGGAGGPPPGAALATGLGRTGVGITGRGGAPNEAAEGGGGGGAAGAAVAAGAVANVGCSPRDSSAAGRSLNSAAARSSSDGFSTSSTALAASRASRALSSRSASIAASACASASAAATSAAVRRRRMGRASGAAATGSPAATFATRRRSRAAAASVSLRSPRPPRARRCPGGGRSHPPPARRTAVRRAAAWPAPPRPPRPPARPGARGPAAGRSGRSRRLGGRVAPGRRLDRRPRLVLAALFHHLVEEGHQLVGELARHAGDLVHVFALQVEDVLERLLARPLEHVDQLDGQALELAQRHLGRGLLLGRQRREQRALAAALEPLAARVQVDLPAGELGREPHVLAVPADGQRQLVLVHDRLDRLGFGIREHARHARRRERQLREALGVGRPGDDVDALAAQLVHHGLHARALEPDAGAHRVDRVVPRRDGDLGAAPRLARRRADLDDLLLNLRHLELEQRLDEQRDGARQDQPRALGRLLDPLQDRPDGVALVEVLAVVLLAVGDDRLRLAKLRQHHHDLAALDLLHLPRQQLPDLVGELLADPGPLALAHPLDDALLRRLHRRAPERLEGHFLLEHIADLEVRVLEARFLERHLRARVLHGLDHRAQHDDPDRALQLVDADLGPHVGAVALHQRRVQPVLQQIEQLRALELLRVRQLTDRGNYVACIRRHWFLVTSPLPAARRGSRPRARAAAPRPRARAPPSPRRAPPRCGRARDPDRRPWPAPRVRRSAASGGASAAAGRVPGSRPRARSAAPRAHPRRARLPTRGSPSRSRPPSPAATHAAAAIRCAPERAAELACRRYGGRPVRGPRQPAGPEMIRRHCRRA